MLVLVGGETQVRIILKSCSPYEIDYLNLMPQKMEPDDELAILLKLQYLEGREKYLLEVLGRLLSHTSLPDGVTAKTYSSKEIRTIQVPSRALATALNIVKESRH